MSLATLRKVPKGNLISAGFLYTTLSALKASIVSLITANAAGDARLVEVNVPVYSTTLEGTFIITVPNVVSPASTETNPALRGILIGSMDIYVAGTYETDYTAVAAGNDVTVTFGGTVFTGGAGNPVTIDVRYMESICFDTLTLC